MIIWILILVAVTGAGLFWYIQATKPQVIGDTNLEEERDAQALVDTELLKHYPDHIRNGKKLELQSFSRVAGKPGEWIATYDVPDALDMKVEIIVDALKRTVVSYQDSWS